MDPKLVAALIGLIVELTLLVKVWRDLLAVKADRNDTKESRDRDSQLLHDKVLKLEFTTAQLKDSQALTATCVDDLRDTCAALNTGVAKLDMAVANLTDAIKELRK